MKCLWVCWCALMSYDCRPWLHSFLADRKQTSLPEHTSAATKAPQTRGLQDRSELHSCWPQSSSLTGESTSPTLRAYGFWHSCLAGPESHHLCHRLGQLFQNEVRNQVGLVTETYESCELWYSVTINTPCLLFICNFPLPLSCAHLWRLHPSLVKDNKRRCFLCYADRAPACRLAVLNEINRMTQFNKLIVSLIKSSVQEIAGKYWLRP